MLEFVLFILGGLGGLFFDLNPIEAILAGLVALCAFRGWLPGFRWTAAGKAFVRLAHRRTTAVIAVFFVALALRAALLPLLPVPHPVVADEFSHLLIADTLSHGRLSNPTHPLWKHFESIHIIQQPTYNSDYFPGQGAVLALGERAGHPWIAVWILCAAMCAALCWMLQGWLSPTWALFAALLAVLRFDIASYWVNSYYGGCLAAIGGALVLGAYPRLCKKPAWNTALLFGLGVVTIVYTRPFEGLAILVSVAVAYGIALVKGGARFWPVLPAAAIVLAGAACLFLYCRAVTGDPLRTPYAVNQETYGWPMTLPWFHPHEVNLANVELRRYYDYEREVHDRSSSIAGELKYSTLKLQETWRFYFGPALSIPLLMLARVWRSRRIRLLLICGGLTILASLVEVGSSPHYSAAATGCFLGVLAEGSRYLRRYRYKGRPVGSQLVLALPVIIVAILGTRIALERAHLPFTQTANFESWCCVVQGNLNKPRIFALLQRTGGEHLVIVKPKQNPDNLFQWIYNEADIDAAPVVWARDMGAQGNHALIEYFRGRTVWLLDPDAEPARITPYPVGRTASAPEPWSGSAP
jgi:hypothetical protein